MKKWLEKLEGSEVEIVVRETQWWERYREEQEKERECGERL